jgi:hypothetical protein
MAPHVQAALGRTAQAKLAPLGPLRRPARPSLPAPAQRTSPAPPRVVQRSQATKEELEVASKQVLPTNITGMNRDGETVNTAGGTWTAKRYVAVLRLADAPAWGASMTLEFTPKAPANATKIALVQSVLSFKNADFYYLGESTVEARAFAGTSIDQVSHSRSPFYADDPATGNGTLGSSSEQEEAGEHGYRYQDNEEWKVKAAWLRDVPHFRNVKAFSCQVFETTALAVEGTDRGKYYGSVKWGWRRKYDGGVQLDPLEIASKGSVSDAFDLSIAQWNKTRTSLDQTPQQLPKP